jgi:hypothetical protein
MGPIHWIHEWGLAYGIYPWVSTLVMEIEGRRFWVERGCFFSGGGGGGEEELQGTTVETFSQDDASSKQPCLCYILYISQWFFSLPRMSLGHREGGPRSSIALGRHMRCSASTTRRPSPRIEDGEGVVALRSATDSTEQWV